MDEERQDTNICSGKSTHFQGLQGKREDQFIMCCYCTQKKEAKKICTSLPLASKASIVATAHARSNAKSAEAGNLRNALSNKILANEFSHHN